MCRGYEEDRSGDYEALNIKAFHIRLLFSDRDQKYSDSLTLHFPARINGGDLEIGGTTLRSNAPAFLTLHRVVNGGGAGAVYGSRERLRVAEGSRFEIYAGDDVRVVRGTLRKDENSWRLDCGGDWVAAEADVWVETATEVVTERVKIGRRRRRRSGVFNMGCSLEEIPEQRECEYSGCHCGGEWEYEKGSAAADGGAECECEAEVEGVRWAVDVGIWVACLGVGYLVSKASRNKNIVGRLLI